MIRDLLGTDSEKEAFRVILRPREIAAAVAATGLSAEAFGGTWDAWRLRDEQRWVLVEYRPSREAVALDWVQAHLADVDTTDDLADDVRRLRERRAVAMAALRDADMALYHAERRAGALDAKPLMQVRETTGLRDMENMLADLLFESRKDQLFGVAMAVVTADSLSLLALGPDGATLGPALRYLIARIERDHDR